MSLAAFMADARDEGPLTEWVDGEVVVHVPPTVRHQDVARLLVMLLDAFVEFFRLGRAFVAPIGLLVAPEGPLRQPDVVVVTRGNLAAVRPAYLQCPVDLVVEVLSADSIRRDRVEKMAEYARGGVREYWVLDARAGQAGEEFYVRDESGRYRAAAADAQGVYRSSALPGFWLRTAWLRADPLPDPWMTVAEIAGLPTSAVQAMRRARERGPLGTGQGPDGEE